MARLPDLVLDSKIDTHFQRNFTIHTYHESDPASLQRTIPRLESWHREKQIGVGGFGSIWLEKCTDGYPGGEMIRAVKQIRTVRGSAKPIDYNRELEAIAKFSHRKYEHCFVKSFGWFEDPDNLFIAMEYLELGDLHTYLDKVQLLPEHEAREITFQILDGLNFMHGNGFAHRDLKPSNILLKSQPPHKWWVKIADFGISKRIEDEIGASVSIPKGTPGFAAPEVHGFIERGSLYAADIWALGEVTFQMLTQKPTFENLGYLYEYARKMEKFPSARLREANQTVKSPKGFASHVEEQFLQPSSDSSFLQNAGATAEVDSTPERFATWSSIPSSNDRTGAAIHSESVETVREVLPEKLDSILDSETPNLSPSDPLVSDPSRHSEIGLDQRLEKQIAPYGLCWTANDHVGLVASVVFSPDGEVIASASHDGKIRLRDAVTGKPRFTLRGHQDRVEAVTFSPDGTIVASGSQDKTVRLWNTATGELLSTFEGHSSPIYSIAISPDGAVIIYGSSGGDMWLWDMKTRTILRMMIARESVRFIAVSPKGTMFASTDGSFPLSVRLWEFGTGKLLRTLNDYFAWSGHIAFSPDGSMIACVCGGLSNGVGMWDVATGNKVLKVERSHGFFSKNGFFSRIAFSPDGTMLALGTDDGIVELRESATGKILHSLRGHKTAIYGLAFSPDGTTIVSGSNDCTVRLWKAGIGT